MSLSCAPSSEAQRCSDGFYGATASCGHGTSRDRKFLLQVSQYSSCMLSQHQQASLRRSMHNISRTSAWLHKSTHIYQVTGDVPHLMHNSLVLPCLLQGSFPAQHGGGRVPGCRRATAPQRSVHGRGPGRPRPAPSPTQVAACHAQHRPWHTLIKLATLFCRDGMLSAQI